jgi:Tol biopolymer transport system component/DNA-binding winged helix-turn-helix (wHTH) protein
MGNKSFIFNFADVEVREREFTLVKAGVVQAVEPKAFRVLLIFLRNPKKLISKEELLNAVWGDAAVTENSLTRSIALLRRLLGDDAHSPRFIETVTTVGYRWVCSVEVTEDFADSQGLPTAGAAVPASAGPLATREASGLAQDRLRLWGWRLAAGIAATTVLVAVLVYWGWHVVGKDRSGQTRAVKGPSANMRITPLTSLAGMVRGPSISPDGDKFAFFWDGGNGFRYDLYVQLIGGEKPLRLTQTRHGILCCAEWSPDGKKITFVRCDDQGGGIYVVPALGGLERRLSDEPCPFADPISPQWSADGNSLVIGDRCAPEAPPGLVVLSLATGEKRCLDSPDPDDEVDDVATLSPDKKTVSFVRRTSWDVTDLYTVAVAGGAAHRLTTDGKGILDAMWSADGKRIIFSSDRGGTWAGPLWQVPAKGGAIGRETVYPSIGSLSRDGRRLLYEVSVSGPPEAVWSLKLSNPGGQVLSSREALVSSNGEGEPQLSPDERQIVWASRRSGQGEIWKSNADGSDPQQLTLLPGWAGTPRWSPDGKQIAFDYRPEKHSEIFVMDSDGRNQRSVAAGNSEYPSWSADGRSVYFACHRTGDWQIWKRELATGRETQITHHGGFCAFESYDGKTVYYYRDDSGGLWSVPAAGGNEQLVIDRLHLGPLETLAVCESGVYVIDSEADPGPSVVFYSFETRKAANVYTLKQAALDGQGDLSSSRDCRTVLAAQSAPGQSSIHMAENFE